MEEGKGGRGGGNTLAISDVPIRFFNHKGRGGAFSTRGSWTGLIFINPRGF